MKFSRQNYRAFYKGEMIYFSLGDLFEQSGIQDAFQAEWLHGLGIDVNSGAAVLMQSTGIEDEVNQEIFESDIMLAPNKTLWIIKFGLTILPETSPLSAGFYAECISEGLVGETSGGIGWHDGKVTGNFYKNPELVKDILK